MLLGDWKGGHIRNVQVLGTLESPYVTTLEAVAETRVRIGDGAASGEHGGAVIGKTGWINRLSNLHRLRLIRKERVGREYKFHALS
jgi:hypothetical protein